WVRRRSAVPSAMSPVWQTRSVLPCSAGVRFLPGLKAGASSEESGEPTPQGQFNRAGQQLLLVLGTELVHRRTPLCP
ncbi:hypothetical protein ABZT45_46115, partial [Streptomyces sp. NPDC005356]|uniref:hypothetical protein n=1 Tax=Streptomyces sp. NPDC005356 TaxID=3157167 RepID=UPI0033AB1504